MDREKVRQFQMLRGSSKKTIKELKLIAKTQLFSMSNMRKNAEIASKIFKIEAECRDRLSFTQLSGGVPWLIDTDEVPSVIC